ncbi:MAG: riboflavin synthase, alpha subunit [Symbiobacteriaceae bacterium]|jgi:riboflavin synthase|nr:riboflavin synthase, alpha subunit [Symbiobacteriaceae bacterium]
MFTGLIEETGTVRRVERAGRSLHLTVSARRVLERLRIGDSIAVNGVCLTVVAFDGASLTADVMPETFAVTNLAVLSPGTRVNLERTMALGDRFGGHIVQGHVDGTGKVLALERDEIAVRLTVGAAGEVLRYLVPRGSVAIDGASLTVVDVGADRFSVSLIPHTFAVTALGARRVGDQVNLEVDVLAKYVERLLVGSAGGAAAPGPRAAHDSRITESFLKEHGF